jgi:hypothetical protein
MAVLGLSYLQFMKYTWVPLFISLLFVFYYVFIYLDEKEVFINKPELNNTKGIVLPTLPLVISIVLMCFKVEPYIIFPFTTVVYLLITKERKLKKILKYINWKLTIIVTVIIYVSTIVKTYNKEILESLETLSGSLNIHTFVGFVVISSLAFTFSFILGSSSKYAGIVALLCSVFGLQFLTYFLTLEFAAYILSPTHKCVMISSQYFKTSIQEYYKVLLLWSIILIGYGLISILL